MGVYSNTRGSEYLCDPRMEGTLEAQNFILGIIANECICDTN